mgnify:CR=1 FL=1
MHTFSFEIRSVDWYASLRGRAPLRSIGSTLGVKQSMLCFFRNLNRLIFTSDGNKKLLQISVFYMYSRKWSHRRHDDFRAIAIDSIQRCDDISNPVPVSSADNCPEISWIIDPIEHECESSLPLSLARTKQSMLCFFHLHHDQSEIIACESADLLEFFHWDSLMRKTIVIILQKKPFHNLEIRGYEFFYSLPPFDEKTSWLFPSEFIMEVF